MRIGDNILLSINGHSLPAYVTRVYGSGLFEAVKDTGGYVTSPAFLYGPENLEKNLSEDET